MRSDDSSMEAALEYLSGAVRALNRGAALSAVMETLEAARHCYSLFRHATAQDAGAYKKGWLEIARALTRLPPSVLREAVRINDEERPAAE